ncbi:hypothetical protein A2U01_0055627, partial [Trifolium medium]|nr:hypothetical protein [Trifolium medium]
RKTLTCRATFMNQRLTTHQNAIGNIWKITFISPNARAIQITRGDFTLSTSLTSDTGILSAPEERSARISPVLAGTPDFHF